MQDDPFLKAAQACFDLAQNYLQKPLLRDISKLDLSVHYQAVCEIVCFLLHLSDRLIKAEASELFRNLYIERMGEYSEVGNDWLERLYDSNS